MTHPTAREQRQTESPRHDAWVRATDLPLLVLALASIPLLILEAREDSDLADSATAANWAIWAAFAFDLLVRLVLTKRKRIPYLIHHWFDVAIVALAIVPLFQPLRVLRSARMLRLVRSLRVLGFVGRAWTSVEALWNGMHGRIVSSAVAVVIAAGSTATWMVERDGDGPIQSYPDALWWSVTTITTVGYGDTYPVTPEGRGIAAFVMLAGIAVFGVISANLAAFLIRTEQTSNLEAEIESLHRKIDRMLADR